MFHVKQEKRALASANLIYEGLCQCMEQKVLDNPYTNPGAAFTNPTCRPVLSLSYGQPSSVSTNSYTQHAPRAISGLFYGTAHRHLIRCPHNLAEKRQTRICRRTAQHSQTVYAVYSRKRTHHLNCAPWQIFFTRPFQKLYLPKQKLLQINLLPVTVSLFLYFYLINSYRNVYQMRRHFYFPLLGQAESL